MKNLSTLYDLKINNTLTNKLEKFVPHADKCVQMYVCGVTPYDYSHVGHGRVYVTFDVLFRLLTFLGYQVSYCRNFTDVDDKLINRAQKDCNNPHVYLDIATQFINAYHEDMHRLNCLPPTFEPRVTEHIDQIINFISGLINADKAYISTAGDVYFDISNFKSYGKLSKRNINDLMAGARVEVREDKKSPLDFALWKTEPKDQPGWQSPWGWGRPGWHIECSALAKQYLGESIDIHAGGFDLIFPHHENEIAQSEALSGKTFAHYWMHNAFVRINQEKMSKSLGNFFTLRDIFEKFHPHIVRYYYLNHYYRHPLDFSFQDLEAFTKSYHRLTQALQNIQALTVRDLQEAEISPDSILHKLLTALCDDLNTAKLFGIVFDNLKLLTQDAKQAQLVKTFLTEILGLALEVLPEEKVMITPEIEALIQKREAARQAKDWAEADKLREQLRELGYEAQDKKK
jgi:cysteinyl-tRNA synthetase